MIDKFQNSEKLIQVTSKTLYAFPVDAKFSFNIHTSRFHPSNVCVWRFSTMTITNKKAYNPFSYESFFTWFSSTLFEILFVRIFSLVSRRWPVLCYFVSSNMWIFFALPTHSPNPPFFPLYTSQTYRRQR